MNKLTDNEIVKALECCIDCKCKECPCYKNIEGEKRCTEIDEEEILDLINRLKAQKKELDEKLIIQKGLIDTQKAEIERLQKECICLEEQRNAYKDIVDTCETGAIKEFAERLKIEAFECDVSFGYGKECYQQAVAVIEIDNLVKEMTEVNENE